MFPSTDLADLELQLAELEEHMSPLFTKRRELRERIAEMRPPAALPSRRNQTDTQRRIERCPRCGTRLPESEGADSK